MSKRVKRRPCRITDSPSTAIERVPLGADVGVGVALGVAVGEAVGITTTALAGDGVFVKSIVGVAVAIGVAERVAIGRAVGVGVWVGVGMRLIPGDGMVDISDTGFIVDFAHVHWLLAQTHSFCTVQYFIRIAE